MENPIVSYFSLGGLVIILLLLLLRRPEFLQGILQGIRPFRALHYIEATLFGVVVGYRMLGEILGIKLSPWTLLTSILSIFFTFHSSVILNDLYDQEIDQVSQKKTPLVRRVFTPKEYRRLGVVSFFFSILFSYSLSYVSFLIVVACHSISFLYSAPPFRLKRIFLISTFLLALSGWLSILIGFSYYGGTKSLLIFPSRLSLLFLGGFLLTIPFKDILDIPGDRRGGVRTLYTLLGDERGKQINSGLFLLAYGLSPILLRFPGLHFVAIPSGVLSAYFILRKPFREAPVFLIYFAFLIVLLILLWNRIDLVLPDFI